MRFPGGPTFFPRFCRIHLGLRVWKPYATWKPVSEELIKDALEIVLDVKTHPIMVMCSSGIHQTGTVVGCLRRLQKWNLTSLLGEYRRYAGSKARYANEQFMELFDEDLVTLPKDLPAWFIDQKRMMGEEENELQKLLQSSKNGQNDESDSLLPMAGISAFGTFSPSVLDDSEMGPEYESVASSLANGIVAGNFSSMYYLRSSPLTTECQSYKRKIIGKVE